MFSPDSNIHKCFLGSRTRARVVLALAEHGEMHVTMLAAACRTNARMISMAIEGGEPFFSTPLALRTLGLVARRRRLGDWAYRLTEPGWDALALAEAARRDELNRGPR